MPKSKEVKKAAYVPDEREKKVLRLFKKVTAIPFLLVFLAFLMPFFTMSISTEKDGDKLIYETGVYQLVSSGVNLDEKVTPENMDLLAVSVGKEMEKKLMEDIQKMAGDSTNVKALDSSAVLNLGKTALRGKPVLPPITTLWVILIGVFLSALFALFTPLGSIALSMLTWISMWGNLGLISGPLMEISKDVKIEAGIGVYAATFMIFFGVAMNFASIIRPIIMELKARRKAKKEAKAEVK